MSLKLLTRDQDIKRMAGYFQGKPEPYTEQKWTRRRYHTVLILNNGHRPIRRYEEQEGIDTRSNTTPPFCHLVTKICWSLHSNCCPASLEQTTASIAITISHILPTHQNLTPCYLSTALSLQTENTALPKNPILIPPLLPTSLPVSTSNAIHHNRLTVCLPDSLDLTRCL